MKSLRSGSALAFALCLLELTLATVCPTPSVKCSAKRTKKHRAQCGEEGTLTTPSYLYPSCSTGATLNSCRDNCLGNDECESFSFGPGGSCSLYSVDLASQGYSKQAGTGVKYFNKSCLTFMCNPHCPPPAATTTSIPGSPNVWRLETYNCGTDTILLNVGENGGGSVQISTCPNTSADPECALNFCLNYLYGPGQTTTDATEFAVIRQTPGAEGEPDWACEWSMSTSQDYTDYGYNKYDDGPTYFYLLDM